jgi:hypothetical protein
LKHDLLEKHDNNSNDDNGYDVENNKKSENCINIKTT